MTKLFLLLTSLVISCGVFAQTDDPEKIQQLTAPIVEEGKALYRSEMASWYGTDIFIEAYKNRENIGGYISYGDADSAHCIFFSKAEQPVVIGHIRFDNTYDVNKAGLSLTERPLTPIENDLRIIRQKALDAINSDTIFKTYKNTNLNLIPVIKGDSKKVYVLTGPNVTGVVIIGNDYLISFDKDNNLVGKKMLHKNILPLYYAKDGKKEEKDAVGAMHSHLASTGDFITATDICTLMLYSRFAKWKSHIVVSENYVSIWDCENNSLVTITHKAWDKINGNKKE